MIESRVGFAIVIATVVMMGCGCSETPPTTRLQGCR